MTPSNAFSALCQDVLDGDIPLDLRLARADALSVIGESLGCLRAARKLSETASAYRAAASAQTEFFDLLSEPSEDGPHS